MLQAKVNRAEEIMSGIKRARCFEVEADIHEPPSKINTPEWTEGVDGYDIAESQVNNDDYVNDLIEMARKVEEELEKTTEMEVSAAKDGRVHYKYKLYLTERFAEVNKIAYGYVVSKEKYDELRESHLKEARASKNVVWYALAEHLNAPCSGLFEEPYDHYHLIMWYSDQVTAHNTAFHRRFYKMKAGEEWKSEKVRSERGLGQYIQCEPRRLIELYGSKAHREFIEECYRDREKQSDKIRKRDENKKKQPLVPRIRMGGDNDWFQENEYNPQVKIPELQCFFLEYLVIRYLYRQLLRCVYNMQYVT